MRFAHMGDCHLGGWRQPELQELNMKSFQFAIDSCIKEKLAFVLVTGDLFDSPYPPIDIIKETFSEFRKLKEANIPAFFIAGSHDFSASGKSFLDVLEKAGFAKNAFQPEEKNNVIYLHPVIYKNIAIYGYPGKKTGMEVQEIEKIKLHDAPGLFKILMLHTAIRDAVGSLPIPAVNQDNLPKVNYLALSHLHVNYNKHGRAYSGPTFPNNALELEELQAGSFYVIDTAGKIERREIKLKQIHILDKEITNALTINEEIIKEIKELDLKDKIMILRLHGILEKGKLADINFNEISSIAKKKGAYAILRNTGKLYARELEINLEMESENIEEAMINKFQEENKNNFNNLIIPLISALQIEKKEEEKSQVFESRLLEETKKVINL